jgi:type I restriction enzyme S subunit
VIVNNSELLEGYKLTEVGVIPEDWDVTSVGSLASFTSGNGISVADLHREPENSSVPVFGGNGIAGYTVYAMTKEPVVIVGRVGQKCGEVYLSNEPAWITDNALYPKKIHRPLHVPFLALALKAAGLNEFKNRNDLPLVTQSILHAVHIPWPSDVDEQRSLAATLSDMDALLAGLDKLIAKKRDLKQAAMQQLLTGKTRLPGFDGEWEVKRLGDVLTICHGRSQHEVQVEDGPYPILATGGQIGRAKNFLYDKPSVLIGRKGTIDQPKYIDTPFWTVDTLFYSIIRGFNDAKFIFYRCCLIDWYKYNEASGVPSLSAQTVESIEVHFPKPEEQTEIATILSDMDSAIAAIEQRRHKTRDLKQAMMQELLTGKIRLV